MLEKEIETLTKYFSTHRTPSGMINHPKITLIETENKSWRNFWQEKRIYQIEGFQITDVLSKAYFGDYINKGELIVKQGGDYLFVDLMSTYKSKRNQTPTPLTLEGSFEIKLN